MAILTVLILMSALYSVTCQTSCVTGCTCELNRMTCLQLTAFPLPFITSATIVEIFLSSLPEIPPNAFKDVPNVENIYFRQVDIGVIRPCAFTSLGNRVSINMELCEIGTIEANAFRNIHVASTKEFSLSSSTISRIESYAFNNIQGFQLFRMHAVDVDLIQSFAMYKFSNIREFMMADMNITEMQSSAIEDFTNIRVMDIYHATFTYLECNTLEKLRSQMGSNFSFHSLDVNCDCGLVWLLDASQTGSGLRLEDIICNKPASLRHVHLRNLTSTDLCSSMSVPNCESPFPVPPNSCKRGDSAVNQLVSNVFIISLMCFSVNMFVY
ncbi:leucine-rich repeat-containing protein 4C-like [Haliotis cracherodii]|uniref:leucine-rich repeat-containing protein 4C-like n=1 Tax=Haliotis cracherodii TaxID=6455 RepID=UPI0039E8D1F0